MLQQKTAEETFRWNMSDKVHQHDPSVHCECGVAQRSSCLPQIGVRFDSWIEHLGETPQQRGHGELLFTLAQFQWGVLLLCREWLMDYREQVFLAVIWFGSFPPYLTSVSSTGEAEEDWERKTTCVGRRVKGVGEEPNFATARKAGPL